MYVIRQVKIDDLEALEEFALNTAIGMTSLPKNGEKLKKVVEHSIHSFEKEITFPEDERYTFVLENLDTGEVVGTSGIYALTGVNEPLHFYQVESIHPQSRYVNLPKEIRMLRHISYQNGPSELCGLYLKPEHRKGGIGPLLSLSRLLFIASHPERFADTLMARLRGFINKKTNSSPFWDGVGRNFVDLTFQEAMKLLESSHAFIPDILPKYPIYTSLLPKYAQLVLGKTHPTTRPALTMLKNQNLTVTNEIDIFDGGPTVRGMMSEITTIKNSKLAKVKISSKVDFNRKHMLSNIHSDFRACIAECRVKRDGNLIIEKSVAQRLKVNEGDYVRYI